LVLELWGALYMRSPFEIGIKTINVMCAPQPPRTYSQIPPLSRPSSTKRGMGSYTHMDVVRDPLIILRCHPRIFRLAPFLKMLLQMLNSYMVESRKFIGNQAAIEPTGSVRQEELHTLMYAGESAIVQILLEQCLDRHQFPVKGMLEEIRSLICTFLHQIFIEHPLMMKLVHFQGYDPALLPTTVSAIPSMHICLDFLPELLAQPQLEKQIFGIKLAGQLIQQYPLPRSVEVGRVVVSKVRGLYGATDDAGAMLREVLPALVQLARAFPEFLAEEILSFLFEVAPAAGSLDGGAAEAVVAVVVAKGGVEATKKTRLQMEIEKSFTAIINRITHNE
jgi:integrator complex subunit 2